MRGTVDDARAPTQAQRPIAVERVAKLGGRTHQLARDSCPMRNRSKHAACVISCTAAPDSMNVGNSISSRPLISERHNRQTGSMFVFSSRPPLSLFTRAPRLTDRRAQVLLHTLNDGRKDRLLVVDLVGVAERRRKIPLEREAKLARAAD